MSIFQKFIAFVESKPPFEKYDYFDNENCALGQFGRSLYPDEEISAGAWEFSLLKRGKTIRVVPRNDISIQTKIADNFTFGGLAKDLQKYKGLEI